MLIRAAQYDDTRLGWGGKVKISREEKAREESSQLIMNKYASPGGGRIMNATDTRYCVNNPASGALNGLLDAKKAEKGRRPSRPSSWTTDEES